jgi:SAM-dependent methyltransferase
MNYAGLHEARSAAAPHLGGNLKEGDPWSFCPTVWDYVIGRFAIESVLDIGSGAGHAAAWFHRKGLRVIAVDGLLENVHASAYPATCHDITVAPVVARVDLVHCQEFVEHIEEQYIGNLLASLTAGRVILMTHALPGQNGYHHVNERPMEYWVGHLHRSGCALLREDTNRVRALASRDGADYMARTALVFSNTARL